MRAKLSMILILCCMVSFATVAVAEKSYTQIGELFGSGPTYNRPDVSGTGLTGQFVKYHVLYFSVDTPSIFDTTTCSIHSTQDFDGVLHLYDLPSQPGSLAARFDPNSPPLSSLIAADDDGDEGIGTSMLTGLALGRAANYALVTSGFSPGDRGVFSNLIRCDAPLLSGRQPQTNAIFPSDFPCANSSDTDVCLQENRFAISVNWRSANDSGTGRLVPMGSDDSAIVYFFDSSNWELLIKVIDACAPPFNRYWVFYSATTNVEFEIVVADTVGAASQTYTNPLGNPAAPVLDTDAFATCP